MSKRFSAAGYTLFACMLFGIGPALAARFGVPENVGPWGLAPGAPAGQQGVFADLASEAGTRAGVPVSLVFVPWGRMLEDVRSGALDFAFGVVSPVTSAAAPFAVLVGRVPMLAVARKGLELKVLPDLRNFGTVGYLRGGSCGAVVDEDTAIHRVGQDGYVTAIRKLAAGRLDGWCGIAAGFRYALAGLDMADQVGPQLEYGQVSIGFQITPLKAASPDASALSAALEAMVQDGSAGVIFARYVGASFAPASGP